MSLSAENVRLGYDGQVIVPELSVKIPRHKVTALIGPNGCGKSTLLKSLAGLLKPYSGGVSIDNHPLASMSRRELALKLAFLPQKPQAPESIRVRDLVGYGRFPYQGLMRGASAEDKKIVRWAMNETGVESYAERPIEALSGGQQQRVWIAMAIAQKAEILLLDEPTTFLDWGHQLEVLELLERLNTESGLTVVMSLHDLNQAAQYSDNVLAMKEGALIAKGAPTDVINADLLREVFRVEAECLIGKSGKPHSIAHSSVHKAQQSREAGPHNATPSEALF
ncbi:ABC transporter ATP-binding protein [Marinobacterium lutimaris]|uniref:Iron complex transport system ATP-binding protein n=1 Tax=Marinobacterium lutimaris TaxID=568106 RepID=A0A1H6DW46_9GAMM|nr:ABC transporter ATP-binding protein [Marinobacterium lutimaris]SEG88946.1 iron complex transport system ATP-binding protein [Marinobacterium lutimaris]